DPTGRNAADCPGKQIEFRETASWGLLGAPVEGLRAFFYQPNPIALISIGSGSGKVDMWRVDASGDTPVVERMARVDGPFVIDALEPAGRLIVRENGGVRTYGWDGSNWTPSVALAPAVGGVDAARVAADGRLVVCGASGIETFRISTSPSHVLTLPADAADVTDGRHSGATTFSANGRWLAVELAHRLQDAAVCVYDFEAADPATAWRTIRIPAAIGAPVQVAFAPAADDDDDHESTLATLIGHVVELFDVRSGRSLMRADLGSGESMTAPVFVDGGDATWLAIGSDQGITLLDTRNNLAVRHTRTGIGTIMALAASPDGRWLVAIAKPQLDPVLHVMASADLVDVVTEAGDRPCGRSVAFSPDGQRVAVGDRFGVRVLDTATWQTVSRLPDDGLGTIAFSTDGTMLITNVHGNLHFSEAGTGSPLFSTHTPANGIGRLALCPDGRLLAHASGEESIWLTGGVVSADRDQATRQTGWVCDLSHLTLVPVASDVDAQLHERWPAPVLSRPDRVAAGFWRSYWKSVRAFRDLLPAHSGSAQTRPAPVAIPAGSLDAAVQPLAAWLAAHPDHPLASRARAMLATFAKGREVPPPFDW
ncbi:MAG: WD40 repeat domain-containing protein, partial [Planctomycetota bacterium]